MFYDKHCLIQGYPYLLKWSSELEIGYLRSDGYEYGDEYWEKYQSYVNDFGIKLTSARVEFASRFLCPESALCDVGIGSGQFVEAMKCSGYDVNQHAVTWLIDKQRYADPHLVKFDTLTFWDVLEHVDDPSELLSRVKQVIISVPIHESLEACLKSKHLRPGEHIWHFTDKGIVNFMKLYGFKLRDKSNFETELGREDILSYCFERSS